MDEKNDVIEQDVQLNVWTSVWIRPRKTVRYAIHNKTIEFALVLAAVAGISNFLDKASQKDYGDWMALPLILLLAVIAGPLIGLLGWWMGTGIVYIVGKWIGGKGTFADMKMAIAISYIPAIILSIMWIPDILLTGNAMFTEYVNVSTGKVIWLFFSGFITIVLSIWGIIITVKSIAEAHRFSSWRGLLTIIIPVILVILVFIIIRIFLSFG